MTEPSHAVFLSYASQDAEVAQKICEALRAAGIEVWFDQSQLRGGDIWDQRIRQQIRDCALFMPVISARTQARAEGYFRLEWHLAEQRTHLMGRQRAFLAPVCIDGTPERDADVPDAFLAVQWTRLPGGVAPAPFVARVRGLLSGESSQEPTGTASAAAPVSAAPTTRKPVLASWRPKPVLLATIAVVIAVLGYVVANRLVLSKRGAEVGAAPPPAAQSAPATLFNPPPHSIAVLPFVNISGDKEQEYFSDGLTEELLNSLARINELQVAARTSAFSFKGKEVNVSTIARELNVGSILEGSVRRSGRTVRITAQLINATTGFHLWTATYDRDLGDVLKLQTDIANAVAGALKVTLLGNTAAKIELGGTRNPAAFDAYLRASKVFQTFHDARDVDAAIAAYSEAMRLDPNYALAFAGRSHVYTARASEIDTGDAAIRDSFDKAQADARQAIALAPQLAEGHLALGHYLESGSLEFTLAREAYERALALAPGNADVLDRYARFAAWMGRFDTGIPAARRAVTLDPLSPRIRSHLGQALIFARRFDEAIAAFHEALALDPDSPTNHAFLGLSYYLRADFRSAQSSCEFKSNQGLWIQLCLALVYDKLGRHADAEAELVKLRAAMGDAPAYQYAEIYTQWGNRAQAFEWLETALRLRDPGLENLKTDTLLDPLRKEPRFQAIERKLKFPN